MKITDSVIYVGVNDHNIDLFEGQYDVPNGMAYNSYVILDEKIAVLDTVDKKFKDEWFENLDNVLDGKNPDYLIVHHMEPDHSANIDAFMESTRLAFAGSHPKFIKYLEEHQLTDWEISYCCLYALGLKGNEIGTYLKLPSHYNRSSQIREKLGKSEHDTNLGIIVQRLIKELK